MAYIRIYSIYTTPMYKRDMIYNIGECIIYTGSLLRFVASKRAPSWWALAGSMRSNCFWRRSMISESKRVGVSLEVSGLEK